MHRKRFLILIIAMCITVVGCGAAEDSSENDRVAAVGTIQRSGFTTYMYGTHILKADNGQILYALKSDTINLLTSLIKDILGLSTDYVINPKKPLLEYGMDSIVAIDFLQKAKENFGIELNESQFYNDFTINGIEKQFDSTKSKSESEIKNDILLPWEKDRNLPEKIILQKIHTTWPKNIVIKT